MKLLEIRNKSVKVILRRSRRISCRHGIRRSFAVLRMISNWPLFVVLLIGGFLRFYKLDWGSGYFFHPDEYHIAAAVNRLSFPHQMNPELFSYGSFTVYLIYFTKLFLSFIPSYLLSPISYIREANSSFAYLLSPILIGRFYSALFSTLTIILVYLIAKKLFISLYPCLAGRQVCILVSFLAALLPGSIQQAHFATSESILTFWLFLTLLMSLKKRFYLAAAALGLALGTKVVALTFLPIVFLPPVFIHFNQLNNSLQSIKQRFFFLLHLIKVEFFVISIVLTVFFLSFPYAFLDWQSFKGSWNYETGVATGKLTVFYTRQFIRTAPIFFQFQKIFPYALGPGVLILGSLGVLGVLGGLLKKRKNVSHIPPDSLRDSKRAGTYHISLLTFAFLCYFLPNAFLFAKWTRFMAPIFPFFAIFAVYFVSLIKNKNLLSNAKHQTLLIIYYLLSISTLIWSLMFFSIYLHPDVRLTTTNWLNQNLPANSFILTESGNMLEVPLEGNLQKKAFDFYHLEENQELQNQLPKLLAQADYFIIQSRRLFANHQRLPGQFPLTARFYDLLFSDQLGFEKIKKFSSFPSISNIHPEAERSSLRGGPEPNSVLVHGQYPISIPDEVGEETWSVFDHPVIRVYKKTKILTTEDYEKLLQI